MKVKEIFVGAILILYESRDGDIFIKKKQKSAWLLADIQYEPFLVEYTDSVIIDACIEILK